MLEDTDIIYFVDIDHNGTVDNDLDQDRSCLMNNDARSRGDTYNVIRIGYDMTLRECNLPMQYYQCLVSLFPNNVRRYLDSCNYVNEYEVYSSTTMIRFGWWILKILNTGQHNSVIWISLLKTTQFPL